jgi:hypothetical protein
VTVPPSVRIVLRSSRPVDDDEDEDDEIEEDDVEDAEDDDDDRVPTSRTLATDRGLLTAGSTSNFGVGRAIGADVGRHQLPGGGTCSRSRAGRTGALRMPR